jgi:hypothetical protein
MASSVKPIPGPWVRRAWVAAAVLAFLLAAGGLLSGRPWLGNPTHLFGIPAGNLLAWVAVVALPVAARMAARAGRLRQLAAALVIAALAWLPVSILLAGNVALNFQGGGRLLAWLVYTGAMLVLPVPLMAGTAWAGLAAGHREEAS